MRGVRPKHLGLSSHSIDGLDIETHLNDSILYCMRLRGTVHDHPELHRTVPFLALTPFTGMIVPDHPAYQAYHAHVSVQVSACTDGISYVL